MEPSDFTDKVGQAVISSFLPRFAQDGTLVLISERGVSRWMDHRLAHLSSAFSKASDLPNVLIHDAKRRWIFVIDVCSLNGQLRESRLQFLLNAFRRHHLGLVFVNAFGSREDFDGLVGLPWSTSAWFASDPEHLLHYGGSPEKLS